MKVITRFAPSPTGFLHIGGARTALFNWLFARAHGGQFRLRIEDTDRERSTQAAVDAILDGLHWLGLEWDGDVVHQFSRMECHAQIARQLIEQGNAYYCYCTPEELDAQRVEAQATKRPFRYNRKWRDADASEAPADTRGVVRFKMPLTGETVIEDKVQGRVVVQNEELEDLIILRSDGTPTYMLAVVVDDHDMGVTHAIRGDDHLNNAFKQVQIFQALGWEVPIYAHIPLIHGADGAKLSKRHGALGVDAYRAMGYLPEALRNYLVRLGWSHGDDEIFSTEQAIAWFGLEHIGRSPARIDFTKMESVNAYYIKNAEDERLAEMILCHPEHSEGSLAAGDPSASPQDDIARTRLLAGMKGLKERAKTLNELAASAAFYLHRPPFNAKAAQALEGGGADVIATLLPLLEGLEAWSEASIETGVKAIAEKLGLKLGNVAQPLRAALTGSNISPPIFEVMAVLGREETLARLGKLD